MQVNSRKKAELSVFAAKVRLLSLEAIYSAKSGHPGGSLSIADILSYLYNVELRVDPKNPEDKNRDRFVLSKGHTCPAVYSALALKGFFDVEHIKTFRSPDSILQGHPDMKSTPGIDMSSGSLGQGIAAACGMALSGKLSNKDYRVYAVMGDGELQEGECWEAFMFAAHYKLDNLCAVIDLNGLQIDGKIADVLSPYPVDEKLKAFNWNVIIADAHDFDSLESAFEKAKTVKGRPTVIIANSVKGKGVSFMENQAGWHGNAPKQDQYEQAVKELTEQMKSWEVQL